MRKQKSPSYIQKTDNITANFAPVKIKTRTNIVLGKIVRHAILYKFDFLPINSQYKYAILPPFRK